MSADAERLLAESEQEERRSRRYLRMSREALREDGPPVRVKTVAELAGISKQKVFADADRGVLTIKTRQCGQRWMGVIDRAEALRYLDAIEA